jgi:hypothetical protein
MNRLAHQYNVQPTVYSRTGKVREHSNKLDTGHLVLVMLLRLLGAEYRAEQPATPDNAQQDI